MVAIFKDEMAADEALKELKQAKKEKLIGIANAAVLRKDEKGKLHIKETADMSGKKGATLGGVTGATIGMLAGPALVMPAVVGVLVGVLAAKLRDSGFSDDRLNMVGEGLSPGSSAMVAVVEQVQREMEDQSADLFAATLSSDIADQLEAGKDLAYTALASNQGFAAGRIATNEEETEGGYIIEDDTGVSGSRFLATKDGFAVVSMEANEDEIAITGIAGSSEEENPPDKAENQDQ